MPNNKLGYYDDFGKFHELTDSASSGTNEDTLVLPNLEGDPSSNGIKSNYRFGEPPKTPSVDKTQGLFSGSQQLSEGVSPEEYDFPLSPGQDWDYIRAKNQSAWDQAGNMLAQGIVGNIIGTAISGIGSTLDPIIGKWRSETGDFNNFIVELGNSLREGTEKAFPVYRTHPSEAWDIGNSGWWFQNATSIFSTLGLLIPALGITRATAYLTRAMESAGVFGKLDALGKVGKGISAVTQGVVDSRNFWTGLAQSTITMRNAENFMESGQVYNQAKQDVLSKFSNISAYYDWINSEEGQKYLTQTDTPNPEDAANYIGSKAAWKTYSIDAANIAFDAIQLVPALRGFRNVGKLPLYGKIAEAQAEATGKVLTRTDRFLNFGKQYGVLVGEQATEGIEEIVNGIAQQEGNIYARNLLENKKDSKSLSEYATDPSIWEQGFWGAIGGVAFSAAARGVNKIKEKIDNIDNPYSEANRSAEISNRLNVLQRQAEDNKLIDNGFNPYDLEEGTLKPKKIQGTPDEIESIKNEIKENLHRDAIDEFGLGAIKHGNFDSALAQIESDKFVDDYVALGLGTKEDVTEKRVKILERLNEIKEGYDSQYNKFFTSKLSEPIKQLLINKNIRLGGLTKTYQKRVDKINDEIAKVRASDPYFNTEEAKESGAAIESSINYIANNDLINHLKGERKKVKDNQFLTDRLNSEIEKLENENKDNAKIIEDTNKQRVIDKKKSLDLGYDERLTSLEAERKLNSYYLSSVNEKIFNKTKDFESEGKKIKKGYEDALNEIEGKQRSDFEESIKTESNIDKLREYLFNISLKEPKDIVGANVFKNNIDHFKKILNDKIKRIENENKVNERKKTTATITDISSVESFKRTNKLIQEIEAIIPTDKLSADYNLRSLIKQYTDSPRDNFTDEVKTQRNNIRVYLESVLESLKTVIASDSKKDTNPVKNNPLANGNSITDVLDSDEVREVSARINDEILGVKFAIDFSNEANKRAYDLELEAKKFRAAAKIMEAITNEMAINKGDKLDLEDIARYLVNSGKADYLANHINIIVFAYNFGLAANYYVGNKVETKADIARALSELIIKTETDIEGGVEEGETNIFTDLLFNIIINKGIGILDKSIEEQVKFILTELKEGDLVEVSIDQDNKTFETNKDDKNKVPLKVEVNGKRIGYHNVLPHEHEGVIYLGQGNDFTDNLARSNEKLKTIEDNWNDFVNILRGNPLRENKELDELLSEFVNSNRPESDLIKIKDEKGYTERGGKALGHLSRVIFYGVDLKKEFPAFDKDQILKRLASWNFKMKRDIVGGTIFRNEIGTDTNKKITVRVTKKSLGSVIFSFNKKEKVFRKLNDVIVGNINLVHSRYNTTESFDLEGVDENSKNHRSLAIDKKPYSGLYILVPTAQIKENRELTYIPIPLDYNNVFGKLNEEEYEDQRDYNDKLEKHILKQFKTIINDYKIGTKVFTDIVEDLSNYVVTETKNNTNYIRIYPDDKKLKIEFTSYENNSPKRNIILDRGGVVTLNGVKMEDKDLIKSIRGMTRSIKLEQQEGKWKLKYDNFTDFTGETKNYKDWLIDTGAIITNIGVIKDSEGNKVSNVEGRGKSPLIINISNPNLKKVSTATPKTEFDEFTGFRDFAKKENLSVQYNWLYELADKRSFLLSPIIQKEEGIFARYTSALTMIKLHEAWTKQDIGNKSRLLAHEIIHAVFDKSQKSPELYAALDGFYNSIKDLKSENKTVQAVLNTINTLYTTDKNTALEEIITYGLTNANFANFLNSIKVEGFRSDSDTLWAKLKEIIIKVIQDAANALGIKTKLDELNDILDSFIEIKEISKAKEGVDFVFSQAPELANIGTIEQYSTYLDTIFPNSKIKDIVYHGSYNELEENKFDISRTNSGSIYFSNTIENAKGFRKSNYIYAALINSEKSFEYSQTDKEGKGYKVDDTKQIYILGSKQDVEGFRKFVERKDFGDNLDSDIDTSGISFAKVSDKFALVSDNQVNYNLRILNSLEQPKGVELFSKWWTKDKVKFWKELNQQAPQSQIDFLDNVIQGKDINTVDDLKLAVLSSMTFAVEGNIATIIGKANEPDPTIDFDLHQELEPEDFLLARDVVKNSQQYSNLTANGGANYRIISYRTPGITNIQSQGGSYHDNEFNQSRGDQIFWSRVDDATEGKSGLITTGINAGNTFGGTPTKTLRLLELQSGFQKIRDKNIITEGSNVEDVRWATKGKGQEEFLKEYYKREKGIFPNNQFLKLLRNNWERFALQSVIQNATKQGYEKVLIPSGETAAIIEGFGRITDALSAFNRDIEEARNAQTGTELNRITGHQYAIPDGLSNDEFERERRTVIQGLERERTHYEGTEKQRLGTINFYEQTLANIIKKLYPNTPTITDEYGQTWREISIDPTRDLFNIRLATIADSFVTPNFTSDEENHIVNDVISTATTLIENKIKGATIKQVIENPEFSLKNATHNLINDMRKARTLTPSQDNLIKKALDNLKKDRSELWEKTKSHLFHTRRIRILDSEDFLNDKGQFEIDPRFDDNKQFEIDVADTISIIIKDALNTLQKVNPEKTFINEKGELTLVKNTQTLSGFPEVYSFNSIYPYLVNAMYSAVSKQDMIDRMFVIGNYFDKSLLQIWDRLVNEPNFANTWFSNFNYQKPIVSFESLEEFGDNLKIKTDTQNTDNFYLLKTSNLWIDNIKLSIQEETYQKGNFKDYWDNRREELKGLLETYQNRPKIYTIINDLFDIIGIKIHENAIKYNVEKEISVPKQEDLINFYISALDNVKKYIDQNATDIEFTEYGSLAKVAKTFELFDYKNHNTSYLNTSGNLVHPYINPNYLSNWFKTKDGDVVEFEKLLREYATVPSSKYWNWLWNTKLGSNESNEDKSNPNGFLNFRIDSKSGQRVITGINKEYTENFRYELYGGRKNLTTEKSQEYTEITDNLTKLTFFNDSTHKEGKNNVMFPFLSTGDAGHTYLLNSKKTRLTSEKVTRDSPIFNQILNIVLSEIEDMKAARDLIFEEIPEGLKVKENLPNLPVNKYTDEDGKILNANGEPLGKIFKFHHIYYKTKDGRVYPNDSANLFDEYGFIRIEPDIEKLKEFVQRFLDWYIPETIKYYEDYRAFFETNKNKDGDNILKDYNSYEHFITEFALNHIIFNVEQQHFFGGNTYDYKSGSLDANKRATQFIKTGRGGAGRGKTYKAVVFEDIKVPSKFYKKDANYTDSQSLLIFREFENRTSLYGRWDIFKDIIAKIKAGEYIDWNEEVYKIQSQKNFYYHHRHDESTGNFESVQIKNSEKVLIPQYLSDEMRLLHDFMDSNDIVQGDFESGVKEGTKKIVRLHDENGNLRLNPAKSDLADDLKKELLDAVEVRYYEDLKIQQDEPDHVINKVNKKGVQIWKKIIENIDLSESYGTKYKALKGNELIKFYFDITNSDIEESSADLLRKLGLELAEGSPVLDDNLNYNLDNKVIYDLLRSHADNNDDNVNIKFGLKDNGQGGTNLPIHFSPMAKKNMSVLTSLFTNNITNQYLPGTHVTLVSGAFPNKLASEIIQSRVNPQQVKYIQRIEDEVAKNKRDYKLKSTISADGEVIKAEILLSAWDSRFFKKGQLIDINDLSEEVRTMIGYFIPTEGKQSMFVFEVVGFLEDGSSSVVFPDDIITRSGKDFDIDTLYTVGQHIYRDEEMSEFKVIDYFENDKDLENRRKFYALDELKRQPEIGLKYKKLIDKVHSDRQAAWENYQRVLGKSWEENKKIPFTNEEKKALGELRIKFEKEEGELKKELFYASKEWEKFEGYANRIKRGEDLTREAGNEIDARKLWDVIFYGGFNTEEQILNIERKLATLRDNYVKNRKTYIDAILENKNEIKVEIQKDIEVARDKNEIKYEEEIKRLKDQRINELIPLDNFKALPIIKQNSKRAKQNAIFDVFKSILLNPVHFDEQRTPSGFTDITRTTLRYETLLGKELSNLNQAFPQDLDTFRLMNLMVRDLKSKVVAQAGLISIFQVAGVYLDDANTVNINYGKLTKKEIKELKKKYKEDVISDDDGNTIIKYRYFLNNPSKDYTTIKGRKISYYAGQIQANVLDAVKSPMPNNLNSYTNNVWELFIDLGVDFYEEGITGFDYATAFINQPIIINLTNEFNRRGNVAYSGRSQFRALSDIRLNWYNSLFRTISKRIKNPNEVYPNWQEWSQKLNLGENIYFSVEEIKEVLGIDYENTPVFTLKELEENLKENKTENSIRNQIYILNDFEKYKNISDKIALATNTFNTDKVGASPDLSTTVRLVNNIKGLAAESPFLIDGKNAVEAIYPNALDLETKEPIFPDAYGSESVYSPLQEFLDKANIDSYYTFKQFDIKLTKPFKELIRDLTKNVRGSEKKDRIGDRVTSFGTNFFVEQLSFFKETNWANLLGVGKDLNLQLDVTNPDNIKEFENLSVQNQLYLVRKLNEFKLRDSVHILNYLEPRFNIQTLDRHHYYRIDYTYNERDIDSIIESFHQLYNSANPFEKTLAENLIRYSLFIDGLSFGFRSFGKVVPYTALVSKEINIGKYLDQVYSNELNSGWFRFSKETRLQFLRSNSYNPDLVPLVSKGFIVNPDFGFARISKKAFDDEDVDVKEADIIRIKNPAPTKYMAMNFEGTFDQVKRGEKTQTTRISKQEYKEGDVVIIQNPDDRTERIFVRITKVIDKKLDKEKGKWIPLTGKEIYEHISRKDVTDAHFKREGRPNTKEGKLEHLAALRQGKLLEAPEAQVIQFKLILGGRNIGKDRIYEKYAGSSKFVYYYPVSRLLPYEYTERSIIPENNTPDKKEYYISIIDDYIRDDDKDLTIISIIINKEETYTKERFNKAIGTIKTFMSNYEQLENPIIDEHGNKYWNSEGYYMSQRARDLGIKKQIAANSKLGGQASRNSRKQFVLEKDERKRLQYMINAVRAKFKTNPKLAEKLIATGNREIIEKNYWNDTFFGVSDSILKGANVLGKILMQIRDELKTVTQGDLFEGKAAQVADTFEEQEAAPVSESDRERQDKNIRIILDYKDDYDKRFKVFYDNYALETVNEDFAGINDEALRQGSLFEMEKGLIANLSYVLLTIGDIEAKIQNWDSKIENFESLKNNKGLETHFWNTIRYTEVFIKSYLKAKELEIFKVDGAFLDTNEKVNELITKHKNLEPRVSAMIAARNRLIKRAVNQNLTPYSKNPNVVNGLGSMYDPSEDLNWAEHWIDFIGDTENTFVANQVKKFLIAGEEGIDEMREEGKELRRVIQKTFGKKDNKEIEKIFLSKYIVHDSEGNPTGRLIQRYDYDKFDEEKAKFAQSLKYLGYGSPQWSKAWATEWYGIHEVRPTEIDGVTAFELDLKMQERFKEVDGTLTASYYRWKKNNIKVVDGVYYYKSHPSDAYLDSRYDTIKDDEFYQYLTQKIPDLLSHLGTHNLDKGMIPAVYSGDENDSWLKKEMKKAGLYTKERSYIVGENDEIVRFFPIDFIQRIVKENQIEISEKGELESFEEWQERVIKEVKEAGRGEFKSIKDIRDYNEGIKDINRKHHGTHISYDIVDIMERFIKSTINHKYKKQIESEMLSARSVIEELDLYETGRVRIGKNFTVEGLLPSNRKTGNRPTFKKGKGSNLQKRYDAFLKMIVYEDFELDEGWLTQAAKVLQRFTSLKTLGGNVTNAINNVAYGRTQLAVETFSGLYWNRKESRQAEKDTWTGIMDSLRTIGDAKANSLQGALMKRFNIAETQDEKDINDDMKKAWSKHLFSVNTAYILQHIGEYYMQNKGLLAMLRSHRLVNGKIVGFQRFYEDKRVEVLKSLLNESERKALEDYITTQREKDKFKTVKKDYVRDFILRNTDTERGKEFVEKIKIEKAKARESFETYPVLIDQFELKDGYAEIKEGIEVDQKELAAFKLEVRSVNQSIHGIYDKLGQGVWQQMAIGRLAIQFRKWLRPGWNRRFGSKFGKSYWNELRNTWDKGSYVSAWGFFTKPVKDNLNRVMSEEEFTALEALKNIFRDYIKYTSNVKLYWHTLDEFEKANIRKALGELMLLMFVFTIGAVLRGIKGGDDDEKIDSYALNWSIYQQNQMWYNLLTYTPLYGWFNESKKVLQSPFAGERTLEDIIKLLGQTVMWISPFEDYESMTYKSGVYKGENKVVIQLERVTPFVNQKLKMERLKNYVEYYKLFNPF